MFVDVSPDGPRTIFIISDLHLGGRYPDKENPRGFRMCSQVPTLTAFLDGLPQLTRCPTIELVINGDFVDFLAEHYPSHQGDSPFRPFAGNPVEALRVLEELLDPARRPEEAAFFEALATFLGSNDRHPGARLLTIMIGNHDVELTMPPVRERLTRYLLKSVPTRSHHALRFEDHGYRIGDAYVCHGNEFDGFNRIAPDQIDLLRNGHYREFRWPPGSKMVAEIMNPIKEDYPFVDLLKPEIAAAIPVLLALDPSKRGLLGRVAKLYLEARRVHARDIQPRFRPAAGASAAPDKALTADDALKSILDEMLSPGAVRVLLDSGTRQTRFVPIAGFNSGKRGLLRLLLGDEDRLEALHEALAPLNRDWSFLIAHEQDETIMTFVKHLDPDIRWVVLGHTHLAKRDERHKVLGRVYLNSGTWADIIPFPERILHESTKEHQLERLKEFLMAMADGNFSDWVVPGRTFVRLDFNGSTVENAELMRYIPETNSAVELR